MTNRRSAGCCAFCLNKNNTALESDSGRHGLSEIALRRPDVVLLDLGLPDMDGMAVLERLRQWSRVPVLILSVRDGAEDKVVALDAGADDFVTKPFDIERFFLVIRTLAEFWLGMATIPKDIT